MLLLVLSVIKNDFYTKIILRLFILILKVADIPAILSSQTCGKTGNKHKKRETSLLFTVSKLLQKASLDTPLTPHFFPQHMKFR